MTNINPDVLHAVVVIITTAITALATFATKYIAEKKNLATEQTNSIKNIEDRELAKTLINDIDDLIVTNITSVENTLKTSIVKGIESGDYSEDALKQLGVEVLNRVKAQMTESAMEKLNTIRNDVSGYIGNRIELILADLKNDSLSTVSHTTITKQAESVTDNSAKQNNTVIADGQA